MPRNVAKISEYDATNPPAPDSGSSHCDPVAMPSTVGTAAPAGKEHRGTGSELVSARIEPHRRGRHGHRRRFAHGHQGGGVKVDGGGCDEGAARWRYQFRAAVGLPVEHEEENGHGQRGELEPVLEGLHERDRTHAAKGDVAGHHRRDQQGADQVRPAGHGLQRESRALELRHQVEPSDEHHERGGELA